MDEHMNSDNHMEITHSETEIRIPIVENTNAIPEEVTETDAIPAPSDKNKPETLKLTQLPLARIKTIMKMDPEVNLASGDAVFAVTKATELFIDSMAKEAYAYTAKGKRKIVTKKDLDAVIDTVDCLCFLEGAMDI